MRKLMATKNLKSIVGTFNSHSRYSTTQIDPKTPHELRERQFEQLHSIIELPYNDKKYLEGKTDDVLFNEAGRVGLVTLNDPQNFNALSYSMNKKILTTLRAWEPHKSLVIVDAIGDNAFCAGGDIKLIKYLHLPDGLDIHRQFFSIQYALNELIGTYKKPYVALIDKITMGGGAGISVNGKFRVATENTIFAMPETSIGLSPDVGSTHFLPRLEGKLGLYLGLTGHRISGSDMIHIGLATHYVPSKKLSELKQKLVENNGTDVESTIDQYNVPCQDQFSLARFTEKINYCFSAPTLEGIVTRLQRDGSEWAKKTLNTMTQKSPLAMKIFKAAYERGSRMTLQECVRMEYKLTMSMVADRRDVYQGIGTTVYAKHLKPMWDPSTLQEVTDENVERRFTDDSPEMNLDWMLKSMNMFQQRNQIDSKL